MPIIEPSPQLLSAARTLAEYNVQYEPKIERIYLFPDADEIRLVEVDSTAIPHDEVRPYYFRPDPKGGVPFPSAIVLIAPEEERVVSLPPGWGTWPDAIVIHPDQATSQP